MVSGLGRRTPSPADGRRVPGRSSALRRATTLASPNEFVSARFLYSRLIGDKRQRISHYQRRPGGMTCSTTNKAFGSHEVLLKNSARNHRRKGKYLSFIPFSKFITMGDPERPALDDDSTTEAELSPPTDENDKASTDETRATPDTEKNQPDDGSYIVTWDGP